jgi:hypothetical protein
VDSLCPEVAYSIAESALLQDGHLYPQFLDGNKQGSQRISNLKTLQQISHSTSTQIQVYLFIYLFSNPSLDASRDSTYYLHHIQRLIEGFFICLGAFGEKNSIISSL